MISKYFNNLNAYNLFMNKNSKNFLNILSVNIRSVSSINKLNKFKYELSQLVKLPDIITIQETWFNEKCKNLYAIPGYESVHCCRKDGYGGNSIFVKSQFNYKILKNISKDYMDIVSIELIDVKLMNKPLIVTSVYRSQKCGMQKFLKETENLLFSCTHAPCIFLGDLNVDMLSSSMYQNSLLDLFSEFNMRSCHNFVTRPQSNTSIDCVFTNISYEVFVHSIENKLSDHNIISCGFEMEVNSQDIVIEKYYKINYEQLGRYIDNNLSTRGLNNSSDLCDNLINTFSTAASLCTKVTTKRVNIRDRITPWITNNLLSLIAYKKSLLKARRKNRTSATISNQLKRISKVIKLCNNNLMNEYYMKNLNLCSGDPKKTWKFLNKELGRNKHDVRTIIKENGDILTDNENKAAAFNDYFFEVIGNMHTQISANDDDDINFFRTLTPLRSNFVLQKVNQAEIQYVLDNLKNNKSPGYDGITPQMLLTRKELVIEILANIFNRLIDEGSFPNTLKIHKIIPIPKVIGSNKIEHYRPISVLNTVDKIFERLIFDQFTSYLERNEILFERQFGFKKGTGTEEAVVNVVEYICGELDAGFSGVAGVFFDYSKAFDLVNHNILLKKLEVIGVANKTLDIFQHYLANRAQFVQVGECSSARLPVNCGVPQGSVLGPLLFKIYVNDVKNIDFNGKLFMYADDICLFYRYKHATVLQTQIEYDSAILLEFSRLNKLVLNSDKTKFVRFKPYRARNEEKMVVHINGNPIAESDMVKYLGINLNHNLLWDTHINLLKSKISSAIGVLYKFKNKLSCNVKMLIYNSLIHSHLTYLPIIYGCKENTSLKSLQSAQNKALKLVFNLPIRYSTMDLFQIHAKNVLPVRGLYKHKLLMYIFKTIRENVHHPIQFTQNVVRTQRNTRQALNLSSVRCRLDLTKQRIAFAGPLEYNQLPVNLRNIQVLSTFKEQVKQHLLQNIETLLM